MKPKSVVAGVVAVAGAGLIASSVAVAAAWVVAASLHANSVLRTHGPMALELAALAKPSGKLRAGPDLSGLPRVSIDRRYPQYLVLDVQEDSGGDRTSPPPTELVFDAQPLSGAARTSPPSDGRPFLSTSPLQAADSVSPPPLPPRRPAKDETAPPAAGRPAPELATGSLPPPADASRKRLRAAEADNDSISLPDPDSRTAIYDIAAHAVYLPHGNRLEAHSGLGSKLDDPRYVNVKDRGPTPPNVYNLALRQPLFHGVQAIRLIPAGDGKMYGRDGILAHSYMLGPNGQSNGCVSFSNYPAFLHAFLRGEVDRLVVVAHLANGLGREARTRQAGQYAFNQ